jgi:hypothetical protein
MLSMVLRQAAAHPKGWPHKADIGWSDFDVEIFGSRWSNLQLATVTEDLERDTQVLRCRLRTRWSLQARVAFWGLCGLELLVLGFVGHLQPWLWLLLLTLPVFAWILRHNKRNLQSVITVLLDEIAKERQLVKIRPGEAVGQEAKDRVPSPEQPATQRHPKAQPFARHLNDTIPATAPARPGAGEV